MRDLVDSCVPGDVVVINGEIKVVATEEGFGKGKKKDQAMFLQFLAVNSVVGPRHKVKTHGTRDDDASPSQEGSGHDARFPTTFCTRGCHWFPRLLA
jgi:hypothetical protein